MEVQSIHERISDAMANGCEQLLLRARIGGEAPHILCSQLEPGHGVCQTGVALHAPWRQRSFNAQLQGLLREHVHMVLRLDTPLAPLRKHPFFADSVCMAILGGHAKPDGFRAQGQDDDLVSDAWLGDRSLEGCFQVGAPKPALSNLCAQEHVERASCCWIEPIRRFGGLQQHAAHGRAATARAPCVGGLLRIIGSRWRRWRGPWRLRAE
ncbi:hypothetical protein [Variovorax sp.]|uniref:hypothetical protein n=1 Tax=Variovorax sp. TaxID=1871043 RepID=UPI003BABB413